MKKKGKLKKRMLAASVAALMAGSMLFSPLEGRAADISETVRVFPDEQYQTFEGWGTSLCWWGHVLGGWTDEVKKDEVVEKLFNPVTGLGFNIVRYNIGGGENPSHTHMSARTGSDVPGFKADMDSEYDWSADENQISILRKAKAQGADTFDAFSNSAPYWMTINNCASGHWNRGNNLKPDYYDDFARYMVDVVDHFRTEENIIFDTVIPVNEPSGIWWVGQDLLGLGGNNQEGMHLDIPNQEQIIQQTYQELSSRGLLDYTKVSGPEEYTPNETYNTVKQYSAVTCADMDRINTHTYGKPADRSQTEALKTFAADNGKRIWVSETGFNGDKNRTTIDSSMNLAKGILKDLKDLKATAWINWQAVEDSGPADDWGLIGASFTGPNEYITGKQYYGMANFSKFIRPGDKIIKIDHYTSLAAYDEANRRLVIVTTNDSDSARDYTYDLSGFDSVGAAAEIDRTSASEDLAAVSSDYPVDIAQKSLQLPDCPAKSITTIVIPDVVYNGSNTESINDSVTGTEDGQFEYSGGWSYTDVQNGAYGNDIHSADAKDEFCQIRFQGTDINLYGTMDAGMGIAGVSIDGGPETSVDLYSASRRDNALIYSSPLLDNGEHTLRMRVTGSRHPLSAGTAITCDRVMVNHGKANLLENGGFESQSLSPWAGVWTPFLAGVESTFPQFGLSNAYLHPNLVSDVGIEQSVTAPETRDYTLTVYAASTKAGTSIGVDVDGVQAAAAAVAEGGTYQPYTLTFSANEGQQIKVWYYSSKGSGWATLDDVILN